MGFAFLQILPIHETIGDHSPYNPVSSAALSPALLALTEEEVPGLIPRERLERAAPAAWLERLRQGRVKYNSVLPLKIHVLLASYRHFLNTQPAESPPAREFARFQKENASWLPAYTLFRLLAWEYEGNANWTEWRPEHQKPATAENWLSQAPERAILQETRDGLAYIQWVAARQWGATRAYAEKRGVLLMGEMSFGVSRASVDAWSRPELFDLEWNMGSPPLGSFDTSADSERWGQNWGFPPFRWENHRSEGFQWLKARLALERRYFHLCRLDHLRGYFRAYMLPWAGGAQHTEFSRLTVEEILARTGGKMPRFVPGSDAEPHTAQMNALQGREILSALQEAAGDMGLVGELMEDMTGYMRQTVEELAMPTLSFIEFDRLPDNSLRPLAARRVLSMAAYGTHDHAPLAAYYKHLAEGARTPGSFAAGDLKNLLSLVGWNPETPAPEALDTPLLEAFHRALLESPCALAALLSSDMLGNLQRFNLPGSYGSGTWAERLEMPLEDYRRHEVYGPRLEALRRLLAASGRAPRKEISRPEPALARAA